MSERTHTFMLMHVIYRSKKKLPTCANTFTYMLIQQCQLSWNRKDSNQTMRRNLSKAKFELRHLTIENPEYHWKKQEKTFLSPSFSSIPFYFTFLNDSEYASTRDYSSLETKLETATKNNHQRQPIERFFFFFAGAEWPSVLKN